MGVGETSFNSRFTLLAGARPMISTDHRGPTSIKSTRQLVHEKSNDLTNITKNNTSYDTIIYYIIISEWITLAQKY